jgi:DNA-binding IclR family transcriptional regulator
LDRAEGMPGIRCVAAPILDRHGYPIAAITIAGPEARIPDDEIESIGRIVAAAAGKTAEVFNS